KPAMAINTSTLALLVGFCAVAQALVAVPRYPFPGGPVFPVDPVDPVGPVRPGGCGPVCAIHCDYGNVLDHRGCPTCRCREGPVCGLSTCQLIKCAYGVIRDIDSNGCERCRCRQRPICATSNCQRIKCANGVIRDTDANGCETCTCRPRDVCQPRYCPRPCPNGYVYDRNGCQTCQCKPRDCGPICRLGCPNGFETGPDGCPICRCKPAFDSCRDRCLSYCLTRRNRPSGCACSCPRYDIRDRLKLPPGCASNCTSYNLRLDFSNRKAVQAYLSPETMAVNVSIVILLVGFCAVAHALVPEPSRTRYPTPGRPGRCGPVCAIHCEHGNVLDRRGCPTCRCREGPICRDRYCPRSCPNGYVNDRNGCKTCRCKARSCGPICRLGCPNGFVTGPDGCPICMCKSFGGELV
ncbi:hypothetical protein BaRGS_00011279, partial [Batillaria attramentaria]